MSTMTFKEYRNMLQDVSNELEEEGFSIKDIRSIEEFEYDMEEDEDLDRDIKHFLEGKHYLKDTLNYDDDCEV